MQRWFNAALVPIWGWGSSLGRLTRVEVAQYRGPGPFFADPAEEFRRAAAELAPKAEVRVLPRGGTVEFSDGGELR